MRVDSDDWAWFVLGVNPEPWALGPVSAGRNKGGKVFPIVGRNQQLHAYKEAIKEALGDPGVFFEGQIELKLYFYRSRDEYTTPQARSHRKHEADGTNMAKATEDALQGVLFKNDKDVAQMTWWVVEQGPDVTPAVVIAIRNSINMNPRPNFPIEIATMLSELGSDNNDNDWN